MEAEQGKGWAKGNGRASLGLVPYPFHHATLRTVHTAMPRWAWFLVPLTTTKLGDTPVPFIIALFISGTASLGAEVRAMSALSKRLQHVTAHCD
eukprot:gene12624-biopygen5087